MHPNPDAESAEASVIDPIVTHCAHWGFDDHQYFGHRVFGELLGAESLTGLTALSVLGRKLDAEALGVLDDIAVALTLADPRIWPLKLARSLATYGGSLAGMAGSLLVQSDARVGPWTGQKSAELLANWHTELASSGASLETLLTRHLQSHRFVWGFGTPYRQKDERLVAFTSRMHVRGRTDLPFWALFSAASEIVVRVRGVAPNMGMGVAAAMLDIGVRPDQAGALSAALMSHMFLANAIEGAETPSAALRRLPDDAVEFAGKGARVSPKATGSVRPPM